MSQANASFIGIDPTVILAAQKEFQTFWINWTLLLMNPFSYVPDWMLGASKKISNPDAKAPGFCFSDFFTNLIKTIDAQCTGVTFFWNKFLTGERKEMSKASVDVRTLHVVVLGPPSKRYGVGYLNGIEVIFPPENLRLDVSPCGTDVTHVNYSEQGVMRREGLARGNIRWCQEKRRYEATDWVFL